MATLYVSHQSCDSEWRDEAWLRKLLAADAKSAIYGMDVRGVGESKPNTCGEDSFLQPYGCDYFYAIHALMLDDSYVAQKVRDIVSVVRWLKQLGHQHVHLVAKGWGTVSATLAAILEATVKQVTFQSPLESFAKIAESRSYEWPLSTFIPGVLKQFDMPECYEHLRRAKRLRIIPTG